MLNYVGAHLIVSLIMIFVAKYLLEKTAVALKCETLVIKFSFALSYIAFLSCRFLLL